MVLKDLIVQGMKVSHSGVFDLKALFKLLRGWFNEHDYFVIEKDYKETQKGLNKYVLVKWESDKKLDDYIKKYLEVAFVADTKRVEVQVNGRKTTLDQGEASITFTAMLKKDYEENYEKRPLVAFFREVHDKFIDFPRIDEAKNEIMRDIYSMIDDFKNFFK